MHEPNEDVAGYIAARVLGEDSETPPQQPLHSMSLRLPYEMAAYLIELAGTTDTSRVEMARQGHDQRSAGYPLNQQNPPQGAA